MAQDQIPSASALEDFCKIAPFARIIDLDGYDIDENRMQELEVLLRCNVVLEELTLNAKGMTTLRAAAIASIVGLHPSLQVLRIRASQSPDADKELLDLETFEALWTGIALTKRLVTLNIYGVNLGTRGVCSLAPRLAPTLRRLILSACNVSDTAIEALAPALECLPGLYILDLEDNQIGPRGAIALAASINACVRLQKVELGMNVLGDTGACTLASALEENQSVLLINIEGNNVGVSGAKAIARMLEVNRRLIALNLRSNEIGDEGAKAIARGILQNQTLERCSIEANRIGDAGAFAIADMLRNTRKLDRFSIVRNEFGEGGKRVLSEALRTNQTLSHCHHVHPSDTQRMPQLALNNELKRLGHEIGHAKTLVAELEFARRLCMRYGLPLGRKRLRPPTHRNLSSSNVTREPKERELLRLQALLVDLQAQVDQLVTAIPLFGLFLKRPAKLPQPEHALLGLP